MDLERVLSMTPEGDPLYLRTWGRCGLLAAALALGLCGCAVQPDVSVSSAPKTSPPTTSPPPTTSVAAPPTPDPSLATPLPAGQWATVTDPDSRASMLMPRPIEPKLVNSNGAAGIAYTGNGVNLSALRLPPGTHGDLAASADLTTKNLGGRVISTESVTVGSHPGREIRVEGPNNVGTVYARIVVTPTHIVSATAGGPDVEGADANRARAFPTFQVP